MNKNEVNHSNLIGTIAKLVEAKNENQFRLLDDPDSDNWIDYEMIGEKIQYTMISYFLETLV